MIRYYIRIGSLGDIRVASAMAPLERGDRVVVRSPRGLELAMVVSESRQHQDTADSFADEQSGGAATAAPSRLNYRIMRPTNASDELLIQRLERHKREAIEACRNRLTEAGCLNTLLDVDQMLDGGTLVMHFLGDVDALAKKIADQVASEYESIVRTDQLAELLSEGCGPTCGTGDGCSGSCSGCQGCG